jgi:hypothetical protein
VDVVRGEMQPWSDQTQPGMPPAGGEVICRLLADLLPQARRTLVVGPHGRDVIELVAARSEHVTVLLRSVNDATDLAAATGGTLEVVAGALDGLAGRATDPYDVIVAVDGLDRVLGADSPDLAWPERLTQLLKHAAAGATLAVGLENGFSLTGLLDRRGLDERHGDNEWWPLRDDPQRPASVEAFAQAAERAGISGATVYAAFTQAGVAHTLIEVGAAAAAKPANLLGRLGVRGLEASAAALPLLAPVAESAQAAARAGLLGTLPQGWLLIRGGHTSVAYAEGPVAGLVLAVNRDDDAAWRIEVSGAAAGEVPAALAVDAASIATALPNAQTAEDLLFRLAAASDVPGVRSFAAELGTWARARHETAPAAVVCFDDLVFDGAGFTPGVYGWTCTEPASVGELLAAAWYRWRDRLVGGRRRHPWPPWMSGEDLVSTLLRMSGEEPDPETLQRGRQLADAVHDATDARVDAEVDVRSALEEAQEARKQVMELNGHIFGLERTLGWRDKQLKVRENRLRELRSQMRRIEAVRNHRVVRLLRYAAKIRKPKQFARAVVRRLRG